jgi:hypothetical protein
MKNAKGNILQALIVIIIGAVLVYIAIGLATDSNRYIGNFTGGEEAEYESSFIPTFEEEEEIACGLTVNEPEEYDFLNNLFVISGSVNGCGWTAFEGQALLLRVLDEDGSELFVDGVPATSDWMTLPVSFSRTVTINPIGTSGTVRIQNLDTSGENPLTVDIPVFFE